VLREAGNRDTALDYLCQLEEAFILRADREAESEINDYEDDGEQNFHYDEDEEEEWKNDNEIDLTSPEFYDQLN
jgi:hypothetical protein